MTDTQENPIEETASDNGKRKRRRAVSTPELYAVMEALLPFAEVEADFLIDCNETPEEAERGRQGKEAVAAARRLIDRKSRDIRRKQRALDVVTSDA